jgi:hypothetical protein
VSDSYRTTTTWFERGKVASVPGVAENVGRPPAERRPDRARIRFHIECPVCRQNTLDTDTCSSWSQSDDGWIFYAVRCENGCRPGYIVRASKGLAHGPALTPPFRLPSG